MMSLVVMGEYDDMKYLVKDGSKKLRDAIELPEDSLMAGNKGRVNGTPSSSAHGDMFSSRKRVSPNPVSGSRTPVYQTRQGAQNVSKMGGHDENQRGGDWSNTLSFSRGFHSIWNCGGTGEDAGTSSPTQVGSPITAAPFRPVFEGRDSNYGQVREGGVSNRVG